MIESLALLDGQVQHYAWGDTQFLPDLLGRPADGRPWAEWWLGTHDAAPSHFADGRPLAEVSGRLPYLLKVLTAAEALSLQTHPSQAQAEAGYEREQRAGIPVDAPHRIYRDPFAKPELICALTPFDALCGFRPVEATNVLLRAIGADHLAGHLARHGLGPTVEALYRRELDAATTLAACARTSTTHRPAAAAAQLATALAEQYPGDPSVVVALLLNRVMLQPGEAIFLGPGNLHAYLHGAGVEIMGASDNVVRGGMTPKHVDVDELLTVLDITPLAEPRTPSTEHDDETASYDTPATPFRLWRHTINGTTRLTATGRELLLCSSGTTDLLARGQAAYLAPGNTVELRGSATVFRVEERATA